MENADSFPLKFKIVFNPIHCSFFIMEFKNSFFVSSCVCKVAKWAEVAEHVE